jgi:hypothetical protein
MDMKIRASRFPRQIKAAIGLAAMALSVSFGGPSSALAAGNAACNTDVFYDHAGGFKHHAAAGMEAKIDTFPPALCTTFSTDFSSGSLSYVSVEVSGSQGSIVQVGLAKCYTIDLACDGSSRLFWAWGRWDDKGSSCTDEVIPNVRSIGLAPTGIHTFTVVRTASQVNFKVDGVIKEHIPIADVSCWTGADATVSGETWDRGDQMGGLVGAHQHFTNIIYEATVGGSWTSPIFGTCDTSTNTPAFYECSRPAGDKIDVWTDRS